MSLDIQLLRRYGWTPQNIPIKHHTHLRWGICLNVRCRWNNPFFFWKEQKKSPEPTSCTSSTFWGEHERLVAGVVLNFRFVRENRRFLWKWLKVIFRVIVIVIQDEIPPSYMGLFHEPGNYRSLVTSQGWMESSFFFSSRFRSCWHGGKRSHYFLSFMTDVLRLVFFFHLNPGYFFGAWKKSNTPQDENHKTTYTPVN